MATAYIVLIFLGLFTVIYGLRLLFKILNYCDPKLEQFINLDKVYVNEEVCKSCSRYGPPGHGPGAYFWVCRNGPINNFSAYTHMNSRSHPMKWCKRVKLHKQEKLKE